MPFGVSRPVLLGRGTIQGDTLSPFLFLIFIEPLLRMLHQGGRGYQNNTIPEAEGRVKYALSAAAYADDLLVAARTFEDLQVQARKINSYLQWSGMQVNHKKCAVTGMLHSDQSPLAARTVGMLRRRLAEVRLADKPIPFLHPDKEPYKYLGVLLMPSLNWKYQMAALTQAVITKGNALSSARWHPQKTAYMS